MEVKTYIRSISGAAKHIQSKYPSFKPEAAIVLGSGLADAIPALERSREIPYSSIPGFPKPTVHGHSGKLLLGYFGKLPVAVMQGRYHYYEGNPMECVTLPLRVLRSIGLKTVVFTAAVGSLRLDLKPGDVCVLKDHINFMGTNPLRGFHGKDFGKEMFPDMGTAYTPALRKIALQECRKLGIRSREGVYTAVGGPSYETPAEIRAFRILGGDVVGMSTVPEVIVARQIGLQVIGLAWISNMAAGLSKNVLTHDEVLDLGKRVSRQLKGLFTNILRRL